jgi:hypothetical protein
VRPGAAAAAGERGGSGDGAEPITAWTALLAAQTLFSLVAGCGLVQRTALSDTTMQLYRTALRCCLCAGSRFTRPPRSCCLPACLPAQDPVSSERAAAAALHLALCALVMDAAQPERHSSLRRCRPRHRCRYYVGQGLTVSFFKSGNAVGRGGGRAAQCCCYGAALT